MNTFKKNTLFRAKKQYNKNNDMKDTIPSGIFKKQINKSKGNDIKQHNKF